MLIIPIQKSFISYYQINRDSSFVFLLPIFLLPTFYFIDIAATIVSPVYESWIEQLTKIGTYPILIFFLTKDLRVRTSLMWFTVKVCIGNKKNLLFSFAKSRRISLLWRYATRFGLLSQFNCIYVGFVCTVMFIIQGGKTLGTGRKLTSFLRLYF